LKTTGLDDEYNSDSSAYQQYIQALEEVPVYDGDPRVDVIGGRKLR
jgi:hypothetical protein